MSWQSPGVSAAGWPRPSIQGAIYSSEVAGHMLKDDMKVAIAQHTCWLLGEPHGFRLHWAALEPRWASRAARYLLAIEVLPKGQATVPPTMLHVVTRASVKRAELLGLVEDALRDHLRTGATSNTERANDTSVGESKRAGHYSLSN